MIKNYCTHEMTWEEVLNVGDGVTYYTGQIIQNVYLDRTIILKRGTDDTIIADALIILYSNHMFKNGDRVTCEGSSYIISSIAKFFKAKSEDFDHIELRLKEINEVT